MRVTERMNEREETAIETTQDGIQRKKQTQKREEEIEFSTHDKMKMLVFVSHFKKSKAKLQSDLAYSHSS